MVNQGDEVPCYLRCFPGRRGRGVPLGPSMGARTVLLVGRADEQDELGNKVACSLQPELGQFITEEEALGHLTLGSDTCQPWNSVVPVVSLSVKWGESLQALPIKDKVSPNPVTEN